MIYEMYARIEQTAAQADLGKINPQFVSGVPLLHHHGHQGTSQAPTKSRPRFDDPEQPQAEPYDTSHTSVLDRGETQITSTSRPKQGHYRLVPSNPLRCQSNVSHLELEIFHVRGN